MLLRDFLPPSDSGLTTFTVVTLHEEHPTANWPRIPDNAGIVILGRPALFGFNCTQLLSQCRPALAYRFKSDSKQGDASEDYRTILADTLDGPEFVCATFARQKSAVPKPDSLFDFALVYSGWQRPGNKGADRPVMVLAGTSTLGTWGAVKWATDELLPDDVRWQEDVQGVIRAKANNTPEAFEEVHATTEEVIAPCRVWMTGSDVPATLPGWQEEIFRREQSMKSAPLDLQLFINGKEVFQKMRSPFSAFVLLCLAERRGSNAFPGGTSCEASAGEVSERVIALLGKTAASATPTPARKRTDLEPTRQRVFVTLPTLIKQVRDAGGVAYCRRGQGVKHKDVAIYGLALRPLPGFLSGVVA
jgi:hypothetical protein